jgi:diadenylate cyclase
MTILSLIEEIGISGFIDIAVLTVLIYSVLVWFKRTRTAFVVKGMAIMGGAYLLARQLRLELTTTLFQGFFAIFLIAIVVFFQEEIKHFLEQIASRSSIWGLRGRTVVESRRGTIDAIVKAVQSLVRERWGGLIAIRGKDPLVRHLDGGFDLDGKVSEPLLRSLFDPHTPGHDGALIIRDDRVTAFSCHLPLSKSVGKLQYHGTRHAAALGLAELTDTLCIVVSEEEGTISVAQNGDIQQVKDSLELNQLLEGFYRRIAPGAEVNPWRGFFKRNYREKAAALIVTFVLWFFFVHESRVNYESFMIPIEYESIPSHLVVQGSQPGNVEITLSGPKRSFYFFSHSNIRATIKLFDARVGRIKIGLTRTNFSVPDGFVLENIQPREISVMLSEKPTPGALPDSVKATTRAQ